MSGVRRFLSRREKSPRGHSRHHHGNNNDAKPARQPDHFNGVFALSPDDSSRKPDKEEEKKIKGILERFRHYGIENLVDSNVQYALRASTPPGDPQTAFQLLMLLEDTHEGIVKPYSPEVKLRGAVNRQSVTCYLDSLLFAMFARLDSFEAMLYENFHDIKRRRLAGLLRLWVNMLRTGKLITIDITEHIQHAMTDLGWLDASKTMQQDPSEAFTYITGQLELPMLTLKMDMYHTGKEDPQDDHKFINERLLEVAIMDEPSEGNSVVTLEDCLEHYFNNRIEVKRHLENQRRNTLKSMNSSQSATKMEKESATHIEVVDLGESPDTPTASTPMVQTPINESPVQIKTQAEKLRPLGGRKRADSIFSQRKVELTGIDPELLKQDDANATTDTKGRKLSTRTEVLMPAWQFFKLLPWYTDNMPTSDAQVAAHFSKKRPVLGICLKRYSYTNTGQARKLDTYVDIPLEIAVPNFVSDDSMDNDGPLVGNFRLMLQSVVCHRGVSVNSGHYVCLCRGRRSTTRPASPVESRRGSDESEDFEDPWMRFDDLAPERVTNVDIHDALRQEMPYLLFYQVMPIGEDGHSIHDLPSYAEATSRSQSDYHNPVEKLSLVDPPPNTTTTGSSAGFGSSDLSLTNTPSDPNNLTTTSSRNQSRLSTEVTDFAPPPSSSERTSLDATATLYPAEPPRGRTSISAEESARRASVAFDQASYYAESASAGSQRTVSIPSTPSEEKNSNSLLAVASKLSSASRRGSRVSRASTNTGANNGGGNSASNSKSRPHSTDPDAAAGNGAGSERSSRFSLNMSRLTQRVSRSEAAPPPPPALGPVPAAPLNGPAPAPGPGYDLQTLTTADPPPPNFSAVPANPATTSIISSSDPDSPIVVSALETRDSNLTVKPLPPPPVPPGAAAGQSAAHSAGHHGAHSAPPHFSQGASTVNTARQLRKEKGPAKEKEKKGKGHEDRDCVVM